MPRIGRLHLPGGYYHVIGRGLNRRCIFEESDDKRDFLVRFGKNLARFNAKCLAWAIMPNHYHLLVQVSDKPLAKLMAPVLGGFAGGYNRRHNRCGYVFQNRYKSILIDAESYLLELIRYIHLNPVRAALVADVDKLDHYPWTGHAGILGNHRRPWHSVEITLSHFGNRRKRATAKYHKFICEGHVSNSINQNLSGGGLIRSHGGWQCVEQLRKEHIQCIGDERILGSGLFVENVLKHDNLCVERHAKLLRDGWNIERLARWICKSAKIEKRQLLRRSRGNRFSEAKSIFCFLGATELDLSLRAIANYLTISQPSVSTRLRKGELLCKERGLSLEKEIR